MNLASSFEIGRLRCHCLFGGHLRLDGGAMFGVVPKPLWGKRFEADESNRISLVMRCLLVEHDAGLVLIDTAIGNKNDQKFLDIYGVENPGTKGPTILDDALLQAGFTTDDIAYVINTHLHFDHAGGNTKLTQRGRGAGECRVQNAECRTKEREVELSFPNATYVVQRGELEAANSPNERNAASYLPENFAPVTDAGRWRLLDGEEEILPGISVVLSPGHTPFHQSVKISDGGETALFLGDLVPTSAHLPLPWVMGYDLEPVETLESKRAILSRAEKENWVLVFEHDPDVAIGRIERTKKSYEVSPIDTR